MKDTRISLDLQQFQHTADLHIKLRAIMDDLIEAWPANEVRVTSIYRELAVDRAMGGSGVHATHPHRAADIRIRNLQGDFQSKAETVADALNSMWSYDVTRPGKKVAIAKVHGTGPHIHLQVHERTQRKLNDV
jgi:hypothetical protein